jgi:CheY-like chemotaxis protein
VPDRRVILVVEDDAAVRRLISIGLAGALRDLDMEIREASDAEAGLRWARGVRPAVVVTDVLMPGEVDGAGLIERLKADPSTSSIPVIAMSGDPQALERAIKAGADAGLSKTAGPLVLAAEVRRLLA